MCITEQLLAEIRAETGAQSNTANHSPADAATDAATDTTIKAQAGQPEPQSHASPVQAANTVTAATPPAGARSKPLNLHMPSDADQAPPVLLAMAFRPFFLLAGIWALLAIGFWLARLQGVFGAEQLTPVLPLTLWHAHEMLFGFGALVAAGFLLTAAQNWTNVPGLRGYPLLLACLLWLAGRITALFAGGVAAQSGLWLLLACQLGWWLLVLGALSRQLLLAKSRHNYLFLPILVVMATLNTTVLLQASGDPALAGRLCQSMILLFCLLMGVVGGRVIPFFTARATGFEQVRTPRLDQSLLWLTLAGISVFLSNGLLASGHALASQSGALLLPLTGALLLMSAGCLHGIRLLRWFNRDVLRQPLLWSLHGTYLAMAAGLALLGLNLLLNLQLTFWPALAAGEGALSIAAVMASPQHKDILHLIAISAMAGMMLAMMARVSLGHTGRPLQVSPLLASAFAALLLAGVLRSVATAAPKWIQAPHWLQSTPWLQAQLSPGLFWLASGVLWLVAFALFCQRYWPVLCRARLDGRPG